MKFISEYRNPELAQRYLEAIRRIASRPWTIMEICGGQTHSLVKNGILEMLPPEITMVHGPGCPVCVTPLNLIDKAIELAEQKEVILCSFGDMLRVPGSQKSLLEAKAAGADVRILYSPLEAVQLAKQNPERQVIFFAVGFETTAPANALSVLHAQQLGLKNYAILASQVLVPPAMQALLSDEDCQIQGFLAAGHVCTIMGIKEYYPIVAEHQIPIVVTGFEPVDILQGILMTVQQLEKGEAKLENQYARMVRPEGNPKAIQTIEEVFEVSDRQWRGIGNIPQSGYCIRAKYADYDALQKFTLKLDEAQENTSCIAGEIMKGLQKPHDCPNFGSSCNPEKPLGAPMVSSEGACAAYYHFANLDSQLSKA